LVKALYVILVTAANGQSAITPAPFNVEYPTFAHCVAAARQLQRIEPTKRNTYECANYRGYKQGEIK